MAAGMLTKQATFNTAKFLNDVNDAAQGGVIVSVPAGAPTVASSQDLIGDKISLDDATALALSDTAIGTLLGGVYEYVQYKTTTRLAARRGGVLQDRRPRHRVQRRLHRLRRPGPDRRRPVPRRRHLHLRADREQLLLDSSRRRGIGSVRRCCPHLRRGRQHGQREDQLRERRDEDLSCGLRRGRQSDHRRRAARRRLWAALLDRDLDRDADSGIVLRTHLME
jgi:hypothetical protein